MTTTFYLIQLQNYPITFQIALAGVNYQMTVKYNNSPEGGWVLDMTNADTRTPLFYNAPFITGADILSGLEYLSIGGGFFVYTQGDPAAVPTYDNLGSTSNLYFAVTA